MAMYTGRPLAQLVLGEVEAAQGRGGQIRRHRQALAPHKGRLAARRGLRHEHAVGHHRQPLGDGDPEGVGRLVLGVVVDRIPPRRPLRLPDHKGPVVGRHPALDRPIGVGDHRRHAGVVHHDRERLAGRQARRRGDHQLLPVSGERRRLPVDQQPRDLEATQVQIESRQVLGGGGADGRRAVQVVGCRIVAEPQRVVGDVVAAVAGQREERVAEPRRTLGKAVRRPGRGRDRQDSHREHDRTEPTQDAKAAHGAHRSFFRMALPPRPVNLVDAETPIKTGLGSTETSIPDHATRRLPEDVPRTPAAGRTVHPRANRCVRACCRAP